MEKRVRPASEEDMMTVFKWSNDSLTRQMSFDQEPIVLEDHIRWYERLLGEDNSQLFLVEYLQGTQWVPISQMRIDHKGIISYSLSPDYRGKGIGVSILCECLEYIRRNLGHKVITAFIKHENRPSIKSFEKAGFILEGEAVVKGNICLKYKLFL